MLPRLAVFLLAAAFAAPALAQDDNGPDQKELVERLPERYREWFVEEVPYIITDREKRVFLELTSEIQRDAFIEAFWRKRDHNPSTPENEFRTEHYERIDHVNNWFGRDTFRQGWQTDRGRYFILLGPPRSIQNYEARDEIYPSELWFYNNSELKRFGLPSVFYLLFWRRHGIGELQLYDPISDGPPALLTGYQPERRDFRDEVEYAYEILYEFDPEIANAAMSFRTDEQDITRFQAVPFGSLSLLQDIHDVPFVGLDDSYADRLDFDRGAIEADYLFTYVPGHGAMAVLPGPEGASFLHWVIDIEAQYNSFVRNEDRATFDTSYIGSVEVVLRDDPDTIVTEFRRESFVSLSESERGALKRPFSWSGLLPLVPGGHTVRIVLRNRACGSRDETDCAKSYTLIEGEVTVPGANSGPGLSDLVLGKRLEAGRPHYRPFRLGTDDGVVPNPQGVYSIGSNFVAGLVPRNPPDGSTVRFRILSREPLTDGELRMEETLPAQVAPATGMVALEMALLDLEAARYELEAVLLDPAGTALDARRAGFAVSPRGDLLDAGFRGILLPFGPENEGLTSLALGEQLLALDRKPSARAVLEHAVAAAPRLGRARELLAGLEAEAGNLNRVVELLEPVYAEVPDRYQVLRVLGEAYFRLQRFEDAELLLGRAVEVETPDTAGLNMLGLARFQVLDLEGAREAFERSLSMNAEQPQVQEALERVGEAERDRSGPRR